MDLPIIIKVKYFDVRKDNTIIQVNIGTKTYQRVGKKEQSSEIRECHATSRHARHTMKDIPFYSCRFESNFSMGWP